MNNKGPYYDQIDAYLAGQLPPDAQAAMQQALRDDPDLAREVDIRRLEFEVSEALIANSIRAQLGRLRTETAPPAPPEAVLRRPRIRLLGWVIAAILGIVAIGVYWRNQSPAPANPPAAPAPTRPQPGTAPETPVPQAGNTPEPNDTPKKNSNPAPRYLALATELYQSPDFETLRGPAAPSGDPFEAAVAAWEKKDYSTVLAALEHFPADDPKAIRVNTLRAHAQFQLRHYRQSAQLFTAIADSKIRPWSEDADWYLLLALLADGQGSSPLFRARLSYILADSGHPWFGEAKALKLRL